MIRENNKQLLKRLTDDIMCMTKMELEKYPSTFKVTLFLGLNGTRYIINRELFDFLKPLFFLHSIGSIHPETTIEDLLKDGDKLVLYVNSDIVTKYQKGSKIYRASLRNDPIFSHWVKVCESVQERLKELIDENRMGTSPSRAPGFIYLNYIENMKKFTGGTNE